MRFPLGAPRPGLSPAPGGRVLVPPAPRIARAGANALAGALNSSRSGERIGRARLYGTEPSPAGAPRRTGFAFCTSLLAPTSGRVPEVLRVFKMGANPTTKGTFKLTPESCRRSLKWFADYGNALVVDYEHLTFEYCKNLAAGWVEQGNQWADDDGLYIRVGWQKTAHDEIVRGDYRYFSPTFEYDYDTLEILTLLPVALTNFPATLAMTPLAEQSLRVFARAARGTPGPERVSLHTVAGDAAPGEAGGDVAPLPSVPPPPAEAPTVPVPAVPPAPLPETLPPPADDAEPPPAAHDASNPTGPAAPGPSPPVVPVSAPAEPPPKESLPVDEFLKMLCELMGLNPATATKTELLGAITRARDVVVLSGSGSTDEALGVLRAWKDSHERLAAVQTELAEQKKATAKAAARGEIDKAIAELRLPPAQVQYAESIADNPAQLTAFLNTLVPHGTPSPAGGSPPGAPKPATGTGGTGRLSADDEVIMRRMGLSDDQIKAEGARA